MGSHLQEQRRAASERPKAIRLIPRARSGPWRSCIGRRLTRGPAQPAGAPLANAIALAGPPRPTGSPSMLPPGGGGGSSYAARRELSDAAVRPDQRHTSIATSSAGALCSTRVARRTETGVFWFLAWCGSGRSWFVFQRLALQNLGEYILKRYIKKTGNRDQKACIYGLLRTALSRARRALPPARVGAPS